MTAKYELIALVKQIRQTADLTQADIAKKIGITQQSISKFEAGQTLLGPDKFIKYIDVCKVTGSNRARAVKLYNKARHGSCLTDGQPAARFLSGLQVLYFHNYDVCRY